MVTEKDLYQMIDKATKQLNKLGYFPKKVPSIRFFNAVSCYAQVYYSTGKLDFSNYYREAPWEQIQATIMHEMVHLIPEVKHGHGKEFKAVAAKVNEAYPEYNIRRLGSNSNIITKDWNLRLQAAKELAPKSKRPVVYRKVVCPKCGKVYLINSRSKILTNLDRYYCTSCKTYLDGHNS